MNASRPRCLTPRRVGSVAVLAVCLMSAGMGCSRSGTSAEPVASGPSRVVKVTEASFAEAVEQSPIPVAVDFWAPWCGPCRTVAPILDRLSVEFEGRLKIAKVNVDENQKLAQSFNIRSIPTILIFKDGRTTATKIGAAGEEEFRRWFAEQIR